MPSKSSQTREARVGYWVLLASGLVWAALALRMCTSASPSVPDPRAPSSSASAYPNPWAAPPPGDVTRLLDGLGPGAELAQGWRVRGISPVHERRLVVDVERGGVGFRVWVVKKGAVQKVPPARTERYDLFTVQPRPTGAAVGESGFSEVLRDLSARIRGTEQREPMPRGL